MSLLEPGSTCWQKARARRLSVLIDAAAYFEALRSAILAAEHSVIIVGWDVDTRTMLVPDAAPKDGFPPALLDFLNAALEHKRDLRISVLAWDFSVIYALERERLPSYKFSSHGHPRLSFALDAKHQVGASHHQKLVVVDGRLAFCGGMDLTIRRWDTQGHAPEDPRRVDPAGEAYAPMHDVHLMVDGEAASALFELVRARWQRATGQVLPEPPATPRPRRFWQRERRSDAPIPDLWPIGVPVDFRELEVGIVRTEPSRSEQHRDIREVLQLTLAAIAAARTSIFIENQYLTSAAVGDALAQRLGEADGPEVVAILPRVECGWLEQSSMGVLRERLLRRLRRADRYGHLHVYCPTIANQRDESVNVHSKVLIIDDTFLKVGSANLSNRSMGLDTECDLAIEANAEQDELRQGIAMVMFRLVGEHLGLEPAQVRRRAAAHGSLISVIEERRGSSRCLEAMTGESDAPLNLASLEQLVVDPERPMAADAFINGLLPVELQRPVPRSLLALTITLVPPFVLGLLWHTPQLHELAVVERLGEALALVREGPFTSLYVLLAFLLGAVILCPVTLLIAFTLLAFGPAKGLAYALVGSLLSASASYWVGRVAGHAPLRYLRGPRMSKLRAALRRRAFRATCAARLFPLGNFTAINLLAGALYVPFQQFFLGNLVGLVPGAAGIALFTAQLELALREPTVLHFLLLLLCVAALGCGLWLLGRVLGGQDQRGARGGRSLTEERAAE